MSIKNVRKPKKIAFLDHTTQTGHFLSGLPPKNTCSLHRGYRLCRAVSKVCSIIIVKLFALIGLKANNFPIKANNS